MSIYQWGGLLPWGGLPIGGFPRGSFFGRGWIRGRGRGAGALGVRGRGRTRIKRSKLAPGFPKKCELCKVSLIDKRQFDAHNNGSRHARNLRKAEFLKAPKDEEGKKSISPWITVNSDNSMRKCTLCNVEFSSAEMEEGHLKGARHRNNVRMKRFGRRINKNPDKVNHGACEICDVKYTSAVMKETHLSGKKHKSKCNMRGVPVRPVKRNAADITSSNNNLVKSLASRNNDILAEPPTKKQKTQPKMVVKREPILGHQVPAYQLLEKQAEEAYKKYAETAVLDPSSGPRLYIEYQNVYRAYEASYERYVKAANASALAGAPVR